MSYACDWDDAAARQRRSQPLFGDEAKRIVVVLDWFEELKRLAPKGR